MQSGCYCGQTAPATKRCFEKFWSCGKPCGKLLSCGQHKCSTPCHAGECPPCNKKSVQLCLCQKNQKLCNCCEPEWQCKEKCQEKLGCGFHRCEIICHDAGDECPPCPLSQIRHCPCGKSQYQVILHAYHISNDTTYIKYNTLKPRFNEPRYSEFRDIVNKT